MNPDSPKTPQEEMEARLIALLLGELSHQEAAAWHAAIATNPELARLHEHLKQTINLVREATAKVTEPASAQATPLKLSEERREKLLAHFKTVKPKEFVPVKRRVTSWLVPMAATAVLVLLLAAIAIPNFVRSRNTSQANAVINNLRQLDSAKQMWALEHGKSPSDVPTFDDIKHYMKGELPPSVTGETYVLGRVGEPVLAEVDASVAKRRLRLLPIEQTGQVAGEQRVQLSSDGTTALALGRTDQVTKSEDHSMGFRTWGTDRTASPSERVPANALFDSISSSASEPKLPQTTRRPAVNFANTSAPKPDEAAPNATPAPQIVLPSAVDFESRVVTEGAKVAGGQDSLRDNLSLGVRGSRVAEGDNQGSAISPDFVGDPEWVGLLARPELPHSTTNQFVARYAYTSPPTSAESPEHFYKNLNRNGAVDPTTGLPIATPPPVLSENRVQISGQLDHFYSDLNRTPPTAGAAIAMNGVERSTLAGRGISPTTGLPLESGAALGQTLSVTRADPASRSYGLGLEPANRESGARGGAGGGGGVSGAGATYYGGAFGVAQAAPGQVAAGDVVAGLRVTPTPALQPAKPQESLPDVAAVAESDADKTPVLGELPTVGKLFRSGSERGRSDAPLSGEKSESGLVTRTFDVDTNTLKQALEAVGTPTSVDSPLLGGIAGGTSLKSVEDELAIPRVNVAGGGLKNITVTNSMSASAEAFRGLFSTLGVDVDPAKGKNVFWNERAGKLMVRATPEELEKIEAANQVLAKTPQPVDANAKFAEINRGEAKALGFDWHLGNSLARDRSLSEQLDAVTAVPAEESLGRKSSSIVLPSVETSDGAVEQLVLARKDREQDSKSAAAEVAQAQRQPRQLTTGKTEPLKDQIAELEPEVRAAQKKVDALELAEKTEGLLPPGVIDFAAMDMNQALTVYSKLSGKSVLQPTNLPEAQITLKTEKPLTKQEAIQALDAALALNGISMVPVGEKIVKALPLTTANSAGAPLAQLSAAATDLSDALIRKPATNAPIPQAEVQTSENASSTFSLNISDVSFKLAAASLEQGQMPDHASIRSEEFINAFDYRDPEPLPGVPVAFAWERARYPFAHNRDLLRFSIKTGAVGRQAGRPLNLVLLLDNSGSMERADRVSIIREALRVLAGQLQPQDKISVITFARTPRLWVDGVSGDKAGEVAEQISSLTPQGGTNFEEGMNAAYATALRHYLAGGINRVVMLTDGAANLGNVDPESLKQKVEAHRKQGIALDCFGIGWEGFNDDLLEVLSRNGDGRYGFINSPEEAATEFAGQLAGALQVAASDVKVQVEFNPARVTAYRQIGYAKHQLTKEQFRDNTVDAAEIAAQEAGNALYTVEVKPAGEGPLAIVRVRFKIPGTLVYREHEWAVPYTGSAVSLEQASPAMRLAATASAFSEWLVASPFAAEVTPDALLGYLGGVPEIYGADARPKKLEWMIRQAKSIEGK